MTGFSDWYSSSEWSSGDPTRNSYALKTLIERKGKLNVWGDGKRPELGDMVFFKNLSHAGVIVSIDGGGKDDSKIYVVQASYSKGIINKIPLSEWKTENDPVSYGHPWKE